jgi:hypothetical protein
MSDEKKCQIKDEITLGPDLGGGVHPAVRHAADHTVHVGTVRLLAEGQPLSGTTLILDPKEGSSFNVIGEITPKGENADRHGGPAMVSSSAYRDGWDRLFGGKQTVGEA